MRRPAPILLFLLLLSLLPAACNAPGQAVVAMPVADQAPTATAVQPTNTPEPEATATQAPPTDTPTPPPTIARDAAEVQRQLDQVEADAANLRGLQPRADLPEFFLSQDEMRVSLTEQTKQEYSQEEARQDATLLWLLLFIDDPSTDFYQLEIEFAGENVLGYYDHKKKEMFIRSDQATLSPEARMTLAHEFVHSLQDQYFDLQKLLSDNLEHDQAMAVRALIEGDATVSGILYAQKQMSRQEYVEAFTAGDTGAPPVPGRAPIYLQEGWQFPYIQGSDFIVSLTNLSSFKPVDAIFGDPPVSTEQVLHPEKYLERPRDMPLPVALPPLTDTLGAGWTFKQTDTLGEFDLQVMLRENYMETPEAAEGWGGARYDLYQNGDASVVVMGTRWDTQKDAAEYESALEQSFKLFQKKGDLWYDSLRVFGLKRSGEQIMFVSGTDLAAVERVMGAIQP